MNSRNRSVLTVVMMVLLAACTATKAQSPGGEVASITSAGDGPALWSNVSHIPAGEREDDLIPREAGGSTRAALGIFSADELKPGPISESSPSIGPFGAFDHKRIQENLPTFGHGSFSAAAPRDSPEAPGFPDTNTSPNSPRNSSWTNSSTTFWALQGLMFASVFAAVETTHNCLKAGSCTAIPNTFHSRTAMVSLGLPVAAGISVLSYELKKHGNRWWYVPPVLVIGGDTGLAIHSARASQ